MLGGAELHTFNLAKDLNRQGFQCTIITAKSMASPIDNRLFPHHPKPSGHRSRIVSLLRLLRQENPVLLVATLPNSVSLMSWCLRFTWWRGKTLCIIHMMPAQQQPLPSLTKALRHLHKKFKNRNILRMMKTSDCVVFPSQAQYAAWLSFGLSPKRAIVINNGINLHHFTKLVAASHHPSARQHFGFSKNDIVIGTCSRLAIDKNLDYLLQLVALLRKKDHRIKALIVGDGSQKDDLKDLAHELGLDDAVVFAGLWPDPVIPIAAMDIGILTSLSEVFGLFACECMAMGRPMLMANAGGAREVIDHGATGALFKPGDVVSMAQEIQPFLDPEFRQITGDKAAEVAHRRFCGEAMVKKYQGLFEDLTGHRPAPTDPQAEVTIFN